MSAISLIQPDRDLFSWPQYWAACFGPAPFLPMSRDEMDQLGWDSCDIILVTGDAYVDHPSFGMAICGRMLEAQGFRVGIIAQPEWNNKDDFMRLGKPNLFFGVTAGNMDSMINRYTPIADCAMTMPTHRTTLRANVRTAPRWSIPSAVKKHGKMCRLFLAVLRPACAAPRITTTGLIPFAAPFWWIRKPIC